MKSLEFLTEASSVLLELRGRSSELKIASHQYQCCEEALSLQGEIPELLSEKQLASLKAAKALLDANKA